VAVAKPDQVELPTGERMPILHEDRSVLAIDKPAGWLLVPSSWKQTGWNLQAALESSVAAGDFWARSRSIRYLRFVHRLDGETSGILLLAKSPGALRTFSEMFESRRMEKTYWAVARGVPEQVQWTCRLKLATDPGKVAKMRVDTRHGKEAETQFRVLQRRRATSLVEARPLTGRTHQIRVHLAASGHPVLGDQLYGALSGGHPELALRAVGLAYLDPFTRRAVEIRAPAEEFVRKYGFALPSP